MDEYIGGTSDADFFSNIDNGPNPGAGYGGFSSTIDAPSWLASTWDGFTSWFTGGTSDADFESNIDNGPNPGAGYGGFSSDPGSYEALIQQFSGDNTPVSNELAQPLQNAAAATPASVSGGGILNASENELNDSWRNMYAKQYDASAENTDTGASRTPATGGREKADATTLESIAKTLGPQGTAALITAGFGMLNGASQSKMLEKKWEREDAIRQQEIARRERNNNPGKVSTMRFQPVGANGRGILGERVA